MQNSEPLSFIQTLPVVLLGMAIVFVGLAVLIGLIKLLIFVTDRFGGKKKPAGRQPSAQPAPFRPPVQQPADEPQPDDGELVAVITAAIACMMDGKSTFVVRRVRRISA